MFHYLNANPLHRRVDDCTVRAIAVATNRSWDSVFEELSQYAQMQGIMPNSTSYIDEYLYKNFDKINIPNKITVEQFTYLYPYGTYLLTMNGHITCCVDGCIYDTFYPKDRFIWGAYEIEKERN